MFKHSTPHTGRNNQGAAKSLVLLRVSAMAVTGTLGTALALAAPLSASADTTPTSFASGQFLSGSIGGTDLAKLAAIEAASAHNNGSQATQVSRDPLGVSALGSQVADQPSGIQLNLGHIIDLGAANQYAQAARNGVSMGASGAVNNDGGVGVGQVGPAADGDATVDLDSLLGSNFAAVISDLKLQARDVSAEASGALTSASGDYSLSGLTLTLTSPAIAGLVTKVTDSLGPLDAQIAGMDGPNGQLAKSVNGVVSRVNPLLSLTGSDAAVSADVSVDLAAALKPLLTGEYGNGAVSFDLQTGVVTVDLAQLLGGNINNEPAGTEVLSDRVVKKILTGITGTIDSLAGQIVARVKTALDDAAVHVDATVASGAQAPALGQSCLDGLLCTPTTKLVPSLTTNLAVHVNGTVGQLISGTAPTATAAATVLGIPVSVKLGNITAGLGTTLADHLLDGTNGASGLDTALETNLVDPAVNGLLGNGSSVENALTQVLSVKLNNQAIASGSNGKTFTETALKVTALPDGTNGRATINLANATVGPNATTVVTPPCTTNCSGCTADCSNGIPSIPGDPSSPTASGNLAFTGVGIAGLVGAILALLAAGAYLVREGYRRNRRRGVL